MIRQCAWCLKLMGQIAPLHDTSITHGICKKCNDKLMAQVGKKT
jgi:hypothetical protein